MRRKLLNLLVVELKSVLIILAQSSVWIPPLCVPDVQAAPEAVKAEQDQQQGQL